MDKFYQVFVSSTFEDLKQERLQVSNTLAKAGYLAAGMELFPAADEQQLDYIKRIIDRSDYYVVIVGGRYGSVDDDDVSYTEREFEYALSKGIPILAFLPKDPGLIAVAKPEADPVKTARLNSFKARLKTGRMVEFWTDVNDLRLRVSSSVSNQANLKPGVGWIRGDNAIDPRLLQDLEHLRKENLELKSRIAQLANGDLIFDSTLVGPDDPIDLELSIFLPGSAGVESDGEEREMIEKVQVLLGELFVKLYELILTEPSEGSLQGSIGKAVRRIVQPGEVLPEDARCSISAENVFALRQQFEALELITYELKPTTGSLVRSSRLCWIITEKGRRFAARRRAQRK